MVNTIRISIEIRCDGRTCGNARQDYAAHCWGLRADLKHNEGECEVFATTLEPHGGDSFLRCPECLEAEAIHERTECRRWHWIDDAWEDARDKAGPGMAPHSIDFEEPCSYDDAAMAARAIAIYDGGNYGGGTGGLCVWPAEGEEADG